MTDKEIITLIQGQYKQNPDYVVIPEKMYFEITVEQAKSVSSYFSENVLIRLPEKEIAFYEWLKENDNKVWHDLWDEELNEPYVVGISHLPWLVYQSGRGFLICDLEKNDNYFFTQKHMVDEESKVVIDSSKNRFLDKKNLSPAQLLALEISLDPIDIWHFAYKHKMDIAEAKNAVEELVEDYALVHLKEAEHLAKFIDF